MTITIGQIPHFDISTPNFESIGGRLIELPGTGGEIKRVISYGLSDGETRKKLCLRRYVYNYNGQFSFVASYKGVRNRKTLPSSVIDTDDINIRFAIYGELTNESQPMYITESILSSLFLNPNINDFFFVEGSHSARMGRTATSGSPSMIGPKPNYFEIYRYGKLSKDNIETIVSFKNNLLKGRNT